MAYQSQKLQLSKSVSSTLDVELEFCKWLGIVTTKVEMDAPSLYRNEFYGDWNYELRP